MGTPLCVYFLGKELIIQLAGLFAKLFNTVWVDHIPLVAPRFLEKLVEIVPVVERVRTVKMGLIYGHDQIRWKPKCWGGIKLVAHENIIKLEAFMHVAIGS